MPTPEPGAPLPDFQVPAEGEGPQDEVPGAAAPDGEPRPGGDPPGPGGAARVPLDWRLATVVETARDTPRTTTLTLDVPGWPGHRAGQHVDLRLTAEDGYVAQRSYSIASAPEEATLRITVDRLDDGEVSPFLTDDVLTGDQLELRGPIGGPFTWSVDDGDQPLLLLAGGSGIVPLMAMLRHRAARGSEVPARLLHSVRTPREAAFRQELLGLTGPSAVGPGTSSLDVAWTWTRMSPPGWDGFSGRLDAAMLDAFLAHEVEDRVTRNVASAPSFPPSAGDAPSAPAAARPHAPDPDARVFVCGPTGFVETAAGLLVDRGHDPAQIRTERFGPS
jgi:ferredoxin-NADP reductase